MAGIQTVDVPDAFNPLDLTDLSVDAGTIDPATLVATYPIESGWVGMQSIVCSLGGQTLGAWRTWSDASPTSSAFPTSVPDVTLNRWYTHISVTCAGGATNPIPMQFRYQIGTGTWNLLTEDFVNPARATVSGIFVPAGYNLEAANQVSGAGGDTVTIELIGYQASRGVALPLFPTMSVIEGT